MEGPLVAAPGANGIANAASPPTFDPQLLVDHLSNLITVTLGATRADLEAYPSLLSQSETTDTLQRCSRFALESQAALYVRKDVDNTQTNGTNGTTCQ